MKNEKIEKLIQELGVEKLNEYLKNRPQTSEAMQFLLEKWNNCIEVIVNENTVKYFDKEYVNGVLAETKSIESLKNDTDHLFYLTLKVKYCWINYNQLWKVLETNFNLNYNEVKQLSEGMLNEHTKYKGFTTFRWLSF